MSTTPQTPVTLATIAAHLGVSRSTVSNAYNHPDQLSPQLRERIFETAERLGYNGPDPVARRLRQRQAGAIGVLFSEPLQHAFTDEAAILFLQGIAEAGKDADSGMLLIPALPSTDSAHVVQNAIVDGFILYSIPPGHPFVDAALRRRVPVVCVDQTKIEGVSWIGIDDREAARVAARHLVELGHTKIAVLAYGVGPRFIDRPPVPDEQASPSVTAVRLDGYSDVLRSAGIDWNTVTIYECETNTPDAGASAASSLLANSDRPTALLCTSDALALGALVEARQRGISVPDRLSVVGFNDLPAAAESSPPLTTVRQPLAYKGTEAARLLFEGHATAGQAVDLPFELVVRESTGLVRD